MLSNTIAVCAFYILVEGKTSTDYPFVGDFMAVVVSFSAFNF